MFKTKKNYRNEVVFFVLMALICFMLFGFFGKKKVLATENGKVNLDAWSLTNMKKTSGVPTIVALEAIEATLVYDSSVESSTDK